MGRGARQKPERLTEKLLHIRTALGLSQNGMIRRLGLQDVLTQQYISGFEQGVRQPPLLVLLAYAHVAGVWMDVLVDDDLDLPEDLPSPVRHEGVRRSRRPHNARR